MPDDIAEHQPEQKRVKKEPSEGWISKTKSWLKGNF
jgi:hypothetical protein